jgi:hypothetical protein
MASTVWKDSPVAETCASILATMFPTRIKERRHDDARDTLVVSYEEDFSYLWELKGENTSVIDWITSGDENLRTIVLIWDNIPESQDTSINVADYVTPFDWALVVSKLILSRNYKETKLGLEELNKLPLFRVAIVDLNSQEHLGAFAYNAFQAVGNALPWVQVYLPVESERLQSIALSSLENEMMAQLRTALAPGNLGFEMLIRDMMSYYDGSVPRSLTLRDAQSDRDLHAVIKSLKNLWQSSLIRPGDRHHVANLVAPILLANGLPGALRNAVETNILQSDPLRNALGSLVEAVGLTSPVGNRAADLRPEGLFETLRDDSSIFGRRKDISVLLLDDQYRLGYQHLLGTALFGVGYDSAKAIKDDFEWLFELGKTGSLRCEQNADRLFRVLESLPPVDNWRKPRMLVFDPPADMIILDLRLWTRSEERAAFMSRLVAICKSLRVATAVNEDTPVTDPHFERAYRQAKSLISGDESLSEIEALALLPLLISYYDPSLPIILFSSTHQRSIVQMISHRQNIITDFAKPILSGYGEERQAAELVDDLTDAIRHAIVLHEARGIWSQLSNTSWKVSPVFECQTARSDGTKFMGVYNVPPAATVMSTSGYLDSEDAGVSTPRVDGDDLHILLARHFVSYLQGKNHLDFASIPWELLEGILTPEAVLNDPTIINPDFGLRHDLVSPLEERNYLPRALEIIRHKKTHGQIPSMNGEDDFRIGAILQFAVLLDFIRGATSSATPVQPNIQSLWGYIRARHQNFLKLPKAPEPRRLTSDNKVPWLDFIAYTLLWTADRATGGNVRYLSTETATHIQRLAQTLVNGFWNEIDSLVANHQTITGTIQNETSTDFIINTSKGFWGLLSKAKSSASLTLGTTCMVKFAGNPNKRDGTIVFRQY